MKYYFSKNKKRSKREIYFPFASFFLKESMTYLDIVIRNTAKKLKDTSLGSE